MKYKAFTLTELLVVFIVVAVMAAFAAPNFTNGRLRARENFVTENLKVIHAANQYYKAANLEFWTGTNIDTLNDDLHINITLNEGGSYSCTEDAGDYYCEATATDIGTVRAILTEPFSSTNPCCSAATCLLTTNAC